MYQDDASAEQAWEVTIIKPRRGLSALDLGLVWRFRDLLSAFAVRDIKLRYRQTFLGAAWVILQPLLGASVFSIVFGMIAKLPSSGMPYFLISYSGMLGWTLFNASVTRIAPSLVSNASLISKVFFPRLLIPMAAIPCVLLDFAVGLALMILMLIVFQVMPGWGIVLFPLCILILLLLSLGIGLVATSLAVKFRDVQHITPFVIQLLMYTSPVGYTASAVPQALRHYYFLNPLAAPIETIRWSLIGVGEPNFVYLGYALVVSVLCAWGGLLVFRSMEREFADVI